MLFDRRKSLPQVSQDLLAMADYIREHGWCQGQLFWGDRVCLIGAIHKAVPEGQRLALARCLIPATDSCPATWNDAPGRTVEEVLDLLERLAWEAAP